MTDSSDIHRLTGAYATDAVDDLERARFEQHLETCVDCRAEVAELREAAARLAETTATPAPDSLRASVLTGISQVRPLPPVVPPGARHAVPSEGHDDDVALPPAARPSAVRRWTPLLVAAVLALVGGIGLSSWQPWADDDPSRISAAEQVLEAPDAEEVFLDLGEAGRATVVRSRAEDRAVIATEDMVPAPEGRVYQLWLQDPEDGSMIPAGLMEDDPDQTVLLEGSAAEAVAVGITVEPDGGSEEPTTEPIAVFDLTEAT
jgi:anti-sigma-K factor RskA